jgi:hypothetical protein
MSKVGRGNHPADTTTAVGASTLRDDRRVWRAPSSAQASFQADFTDVPVTLPSALSFNK